jgi:hypothetical protein
MPIINIENVAGIEMFWDDGKVACKRCVEDHEWGREDYEVILKEEVAKGEDIYFCDRCGEKFSSL